MSRALTALLLSALSILLIYPLFKGRVVTAAGGSPAPLATFTPIFLNRVSPQESAKPATIPRRVLSVGQSISKGMGVPTQKSETWLTMLHSQTSQAAVKVRNSTSPPIPYPISSHPRLWITRNDVPHLQSWATSSNRAYRQGILPLLRQAVSVYNTEFFPGGMPNPRYPDPGDTQGYTGDLTEQYGLIFAFNSLIDPNPGDRIRYAQYARNLLIYAMHQAALGHLSGAPFRDPSFAIYNRANAHGEQWPLIVDWIYSATDPNGNAILTTPDKLTIRNVFLQWARDCLNASTTGGDHPSPVGIINSPLLLPNNQPYRMAANNYYLGHARLLTMMALSIDPGDDPSVDDRIPDSYLGNTLRSYIPNATGAWLYQEFAMFGDPPDVASAYGLSKNGGGFGLASGGLPPEGMLYGESFAYLLGELLALRTAGFDNVSYSGPQVRLMGAPVWDRYVVGYISSLTPAAKTFAAQPWIGPVFQYGSYGDLLRLWVTPDAMQPFALLALLDGQAGQTTHINAARWLSVNATQGGPSALLSRITSPWSFTESILYYLLLDPAAPSASDPRPSFSSVFYDPLAGRIVAHSDWSSSNTLFDYRASWISINHQVGDGGQFELYRKGEWLTKEMSNYDNNGVGMTTMYHNTLALQNSCTCPGGAPSNLQWFEHGEWNNGSQWMEGTNAGDPLTVSSAGPGYVYAASTLTNLYNRPDPNAPNDSAVNIMQATRSIVWFSNDYVVIYDRATSREKGLFKRFNLNLITNPDINGDVVTETLSSGQRLFIQTLQPSNPSLSVTYAANNLKPIAELEPTQYILSVEDPTRPADVRFLHVLQAADRVVPMVRSFHLQSTGGTAFEGAAFGSAAIYFPVRGDGAFAGTTLPVPVGVHTMLVTGLAANASYIISSESGGDGSSISIARGIGGMNADGAGLLRLTL
jgi:hypothetical protein